MYALSAPQSHPDTGAQVAAEIVAGDAITLLDIAQQFSVNPSTCLRWLMRGLPNGRGERVRLAAIKRGRVWLTSRAALGRFLGAMPQYHSAPPAPPIRTPTQRDRDSARAQQQLADRYGI